MQQAFLKSVIRFYLFIAFVIVATITFAQPVQVIVNVTPPYSSQAKDYVQQGNNVMMTLINNTGSAQSVRLIPSLSGVNNNVKIAVQDNFMPAAPIILNAGQIRVLTFNQLKAFNNNITADDVSIQGISQDTYQNGSTLPEGLYKLCVKAFLYNNPAGGSIFSEGCGTFNVLSYDPPIILNPNNNSAIKPLQPQFVNFSWTPSGVVGKTRYTFKLVDLTATGLFNANDAFLNGNVLPYFQQQNVVTTSLQMDNSKPKLIVGNRYALQVIAYDPQNKTTYKNQGRSKVIVFMYKDALENNSLTNTYNDNRNDPPKGSCSALSKYNGVLKQSNKNGIANGTNILVGKFVMKNTKFTKSNGSYNGTGEIMVNFVNAKVKVKFTGVKIGDDNRLIKGTVTALYDVNAGITDELANEKLGVIKALPNTTALMNSMKDATRQVNLDKAAASTDLPLTFDKNDFSIGIVGMIFEPTEAYVNAVLNTQAPQVAGDEFILLSAKGIPIHPNGYNANSVLKLSLAETQTYTLAKDKMLMELEAGADKTFATFDCNGFRSITLNGAIVLPRSVALPYTDLHKLIEDSIVKVKVPFMLKEATSFNDFIVNNLSFSHQFAIADGAGFVFNPDSVALDLSSAKNINGMDSVDKDIQNEWTGLFVKSTRVIVPAASKPGEKDQFTPQVNTLFITKQGITTRFSNDGKLLVKGSLVEKEDEKTRVSQ